MKITDVQIFIVGNPWKNWVFIKLHTDDGVYGVGEATSHRKAKTAETAVSVPLPASISMPQHQML